MLTRREFGLASAALAAGSQAQEPFNVALGRRIAAHRRRLGLTVEQACEAANALARAEWEQRTAPDDWRTYEAGQLSPCIDEAWHMAALFGMTLDELAGR
jgi:transcriptional regulator with XRE-family HTH domain